MFIAANLRISLIARGARFFAPLFLGVELGWEGGRDKRRGEIKDCC